MGRFGLVTSTRPPPPRNPPSARFALLALGGALRRASPFRLALPRMSWGRSRLLRRIGRDARHREWAGGESYIGVSSRPSGTRSRARASRPILRSVYCDLHASAGRPSRETPCRVFPKPVCTSTPGRPAHYVASLPASVEGLPAAEPLRYIALEEFLPTGENRRFWNAVALRRIRRMVDTSADGWACQTTSSAADELPRLSKTVDEVRPPKRACDRLALLVRHAFDFIEHLAGAFDCVAVVITRSTSPDVPPGASGSPVPTSASARISTPARDDEAHRDETQDDKPH